MADCWQDVLDILEGSSLVRDLDTLLVADCWSDILEEEDGLAHVRDIQLGGDG